MNVKIDTKEKFTVITPTEQELSVNMTAKILEMLLHNKQKDIPHLILNLQFVLKIDESIGRLLAETQQAFYEAEHSLVICCLQSHPEKLLENMGLLTIMNITPTESEAWDILQMEEIERELLKS